MALGAYNRAGHNSSADSREMSWDLNHTNCSDCVDAGFLGCDKRRGSAVFCLANASALLTRRFQVLAC